MSSLPEEHSWKSGLKVEFFFGGKEFIHLFTPCLPQNKLQKCKNTNQYECSFTSKV